MGGWVGIYYLLFTFIYFLINFFELPKFLSDLTNQKDHFIINKKKPLVKLDMFKSTCLV